MTPDTIDFNSLSKKQLVELVIAKYNDCFRLEEENKKLEEKNEGLKDTMKELNNYNKFRIQENKMLKKENEELKEYKEMYEWLCK